MSKQCYSCAYRQTIPGDAHSKCSFDFAKAGIEQPKGNPHGIKAGWYMFPFNYDPVWMAEKCKAFSETLNKDLKRGENAFEGLLSIFAKRF